MVIAPACAVMALESTSTSACTLLVTIGVRVLTWEDVARRVTAAPLMVAPLTLICVLVSDSTLNSPPLRVASRLTMPPAKLFVACASSRVPVSKVIDGALMESLPEAPTEAAVS